MFAELLALILSATPGAALPDQRAFPNPSGSAAEARAILAKAVDKPSNDLASAARDAAERLSTFSPAGEQLMEVVQGHEAARDDPSDRALRARAQAVHEMLTFEPIKEAELPEGFPTFTPFGAIEVKHYPKNRRAMANQFFTLFAHITGNDIAMTAPVRMEYRRDEEGKLEQRSMSFYYGSPNTGHVGQQGAVETIDDPATTVVALGLRGEMDVHTIREAEERLRNWVKAHERYEVAGELIVMGYNSPMVPAEKNFFEVQLPIERAKR